MLSPVIAPVANASIVIAGAVIIVVAATKMNGFIFLKSVNKQMHPTMRWIRLSGFQSANDHRSLLKFVNLCLARPSLLGYCISRRAGGVMYFQIRRRLFPMLTLHFVITCGLQSVFLAQLSADNSPLIFKHMITMLFSFSLQKKTFHARHRFVYGANCVFWLRLL